MKLYTDGDAYKYTQQPRRTHTNYMQLYMDGDYMDGDAYKTSDNRDALTKLHEAT